MVKKNPTLQKVETRLSRFKIEDGILGKKVSDSPDVARLFKFMETLDREEFWAAHLNTKNKIIAVEKIAIGSVSMAIVHPREVFKAAINVNSTALIVVHNHPSGGVEPSPEDLDLTKRLKMSGDVLGIKLLDHVIIGTDGNYRSLRAIVGMN